MKLKLTAIIMVSAILSACSGDDGKPSLQSDCSTRYYSIAHIKYPNKTVKFFRNTSHPPKIMDNGPFITVSSQGSINNTPISITCHYKNNQQYDFIDLKAITGNMTVISLGTDFNLWLKNHMDQQKNKS